MDLSIQSSSLVGALFVCGYLTYLCFRTPNPNPTKSGTNDRIALVTDLSKPTLFLLLFICFHHSMLILLPNNRASFCWNSDILNEDLFSWSRRSVAFVAVILLAAPLRLLAYSQLGKNFTFRLDKPSNLVTNGMYAYVQHPSYTTLFLVGAAIALFWLRMDGISACYLPSSVVETTHLSEVVALAVIVVITWGLSIRVRDEEAMLKKEFGKEWVAYHQRTKRLLPGIF